MTPKVDIKERDHSVLKRNITDPGVRRGIVRDQEVREEGERGLGVRKEEEKDQEVRTEEEEYREVKKEEETDLEVTTEEKTDIVTSRALIIMTEIEEDIDHHMKSSRKSLLSLYS